MSRLGVARGFAVVLGLMLAPGASAQLSETTDALNYEFAPAATPLTLRSAILGESRVLDVWTPPAYAGSTRQLPLLLVLDGGYLHQFAQPALQYLIDSGRAPEAIVVGLRTPDRIADYSPAAMGLPVANVRGEVYARHLVEEVMPALRARYRAGGAVIVMGYSQGAILALHAANAYPNQIDAVIALDAPMSARDGWLMAQVRERAGRAGARAFRLVSIEAGFGWNDADWSAFIREAPSGWRLARTMSREETHQSLPMLGAYLGLRDLFADYAADSRDAIAALRHYDALPDFYGNNPAVPDLVLSLATEDFWIADDEANARATLARWTAAYGSTPASERLRVRIEAMADDPLPRRLSAYLADPRARAGELTEFLGEWRGESEMMGSRQPLVLRLSARGGAVSGELVVAAGTRTEQVQTLDYLRVEDGRLLFGVMNGMRPRGLLLYDARRNGDVLAGAMNIAGVRFAGPNGQPMPATSFELRRVR